MTSPSTSRRSFLAHSAIATGALGIGAKVNVKAAETQPKPTYKESQRTALGLKQLRRIAIGPKDVRLVAAHQSVYEVGSTGDAREIVSLEQPVRCLAIDSQSNVYIGVRDHIEVYTLSGKLIQKWDRPDQEALMTDISVVGERVFLADSGSRVIWEYNTAGELQRKISRNATFAAPAGFFSLSADSNGRIFAANPLRHRVEMYNSGGEFAGAWGSRSRTLEGFQGCCNPVSVSIAPSGHVLTAERGPGRVKLFDSKGKLQALVAGPEHFTENNTAAAKDQSMNCTTGGFDVAVDALGNVHVLDLTSGNLHTFQQA